MNNTNGQPEINVTLADSQNVYKSHNCVETPYAGANKRCLNGTLRTRETFGEIDIGNTEIR